MNNQNSTITKTQYFYEKSYDPTNPVPVVIDNEFYIMLQKDVRNIIDTRFTCLTKCQPNIITQFGQHNAPPGCIRQVDFREPQYYQQQTPMPAAQQRNVTLLNYSKTTSTSDLPYQSKEKKEPGKCLCCENKCYKQISNKCINTVESLEESEISNEKPASCKQSAHVLIENLKKEIEEPLC